MTIDAMLNDEFEFEVPAEKRALQEQTPAGACTRLAVAVVASVIVSAWYWSPPDWLQPTVVGMLWASLFLVGAASGNVRRGSSMFAIAASAYVGISQASLQSLTSLVSAECSLVAVLLFAAGWLTVQLDFSAQIAPAKGIATVRRYQQWTIWDLALLTTLCAFVCYAAPRIQSPLLLLSQVLFVLVAGCLCSWLAYRWVFDDCWSVGKLLMLATGCGVGLWLTGRQTPTEFSMLDILAWMLTGPLSVIAAQGLTVLALLTAIRLDQGSLINDAPKVSVSSDESVSEVAKTGGLESVTAGEFIEEPFSGLRIYSN